MSKTQACGPESQHSGLLLGLQVLLHYVASVVPVSEVCVQKIK
jgi:hypothetical protein